MLEIGRFITDSLSEASEIARLYHGNVTGNMKPGDDNQVATKGDWMNAKFLRHVIHGHFPYHNLIDEEFGIVNKDSDYSWTIDPIDGTANFEVGNPLYAIGVALLYKGMPVAGGIALPALGEVVVAVKEEGAYAGQQRLAVTPERRLSRVLVAYGIDSHREQPAITQQESVLLAQLVNNSLNLRISNCFFDPVEVAKGHYGGVTSLAGKIWDDAPPKIIIEEAGGRHTSFSGRPRVYHDPIRSAWERHTFSSCAAAPAIHEQLQEIIHATAPDLVSYVESKEAPGSLK